MLTALQAAELSSGSWNASTNLTDKGVHLSNYYTPENAIYAVSESGHTELGGVTEWHKGDFAYSTGLRWEKIVNYADESGGSGTVTNVSVKNANGFNGTVANPSTTPDITLLVTQQGVLKGNEDGQLEPATESDIVALLGDTLNIDTINMLKGTIQTLPVSANDIANKSYVDATRAGLIPHVECYCATTGNISLDETTTEVDGQTIVDDLRILVQDQTDSIDNGIYIASTTTAWVRASDFTVGDQMQGAYVFVDEGVVNGNVSFVVSTTGIVGTDPMEWVIFSSPVEYTPGDGIDIVGRLISALKATDQTLGSVIIGAGLDVDEQGLVDVNVDGVTIQIVDGKLVAIASSGGISNITTPDGESNATPTINLLNGSGITIVSDGNGNITFSSESSGGSVTKVSVANLNGFNAVVDTSTTTPNIKMLVTEQGILKGNATGQLEPATESDILDLLGDTLNIDTVNMSNGTVTSTPSSATDIANKAYVDAMASGLKPLLECYCATVDNIALNETTTEIDGQTLVDDLRVLVKDQTDPIQNGVYIVNTTAAWVRAEDLADGASMNGAYIFVSTGDVNANMGFVVSSTGIVGTNPMIWVIFSAPSEYVEGLGVNINGRTISVNRATTEDFGGVIIGDQLNINPFGVVSVNTGTYPGQVVELDETGALPGVSSANTLVSPRVGYHGKLNDVLGEIIGSIPNQYVLPKATTTVLGGSTYPQTGALVVNNGAVSANVDDTTIKIVNNKLTAIIPAPTPSNNTIPLYTFGTPTYTFDSSVIPSVSVVTVKKDFPSKEISISIPYIADSFYDTSKYLIVCVSLGRKTVKVNNVDTVVSQDLLSYIRVPYTVATPPSTLTVDNEYVSFRFNPSLIIANPNLINSNQEIINIKSNTYTDAGFWIEYPNLIDETNPGGVTWNKTNNVGTCGLITVAPQSMITYDYRQTNTGSGVAQFVVNMQTNQFSSTKFARNILFKKVNNTSVNPSTTLKVIIHANTNANIVSTIPYKVLNENSFEVNFTVIGYGDNVKACVNLLIQCDNNNILLNAFQL